MGTFKPSLLITLIKRIKINQVIRIVKEYCFEEVKILKLFDFRKILNFMNHNSGSRNYNLGSRALAFFVFATIRKAGGSTLETGNIHTQDGS